MAAWFACIEWTAWAIMIWEAVIDATSVSLLLPASTLLFQDDDAGEKNNGDINDSAAGKKNMPKSVADAHVEREG